MASKDKVWRLISDPTNWHDFMQGFDSVSSQGNIWTGSGKVLGQDIKPRVRLDLDEANKTVNIAYLDGGVGNTQLSVLDADDPTQSKLIASGEVSNLPVTLVNLLNNNMAQKIKKAAEKSTQ